MKRYAVTPSNNGQRSPGFVHVVCTRKAPFRSERFGKAAEGDCQGACSEERE